MGKHTKDLLFLDGIKGISALIITIGSCIYFLVYSSEIDSVRNSNTNAFSNGPISGFHSCFQFVYPLSLVFLVISGFVNHLPNAREIRREGLGARFDIKLFFVNRLLKLLPLLSLSLMLTFILQILAILLGISSYSASEFPKLWMDWYGQMYSINSNINFIKFNQLDLYLFTSYFYLILPILVFCCMYLLYPVFLLLNRRSARLTLFWLLFFYFLSGPIFVFLTEKVSIAIGLPFIMLRTFTIWWLGVTLADIYAYRIRINFKWISLAFPLSILLLYYRVGQGFQYSDGLVALLFIGLIAFCFWLQDMKLELKPLHKLAFLGKFSYSLYVLHLPILIFMSGLIMAYSNDHQLPMHAWWLCAGIIILATAGYFAYQLVEKPFLDTKK